MSDLTPKQARFVEEYLLDLNATQAAIRAKADIQTTPDSHACYSVSASLWLGGLRARHA